MRKIILASQSPRRKQLLEWAEIPFEIVIRSTDETYPEGLNTADVPIYIAKQKAVEVKKYIDEQSQGKFNNEIILAADTVVVLNSQIIGKPQHREDAISILTALSGRTHNVITGVVLMHEKGEIAFSDITSVEFHTLTPEQIEYYVDNYKPYDKAGAYAIQEWIGVTGIKSVAGDFYNVMGLPVSRVVQEIARLNESL
ncbi:Maf family nucleotide pyrophosphatase [Segetibacter koreensis]|uniref:Maf family nucleotide pyrophosphatase n=1 Tax=Segetibacter koreensis TaxID=398037 RepID=UPI000478162F|nr:Maf family nucleotide pyrophosphatase [Segetibacter koreensis]